MCIRDSGYIDVTTLPYHLHRLETNVADTTGCTMLNIRKHELTIQIGDGSTLLSLNWNCSTIIDPTGEPVIGATVTVKGKQGGTITDLDGKELLNFNNDGKNDVGSWPFNKDVYKRQTSSRFMG